MEHQHVLPQGKDWIVKREGASRASRRFARKDQAVRYAQRLATRAGTQAYIHQSDGTIEATKGPGQAWVPAKESKVETQRRIHVVRDGEAWAVKTEGAKQAMKRFDTKYRAVRYGHEVADKRNAAWVVHDKQNRITHIDIPPHYRSPLSALLHLR